MKKLYIIFTLISQTIFSQIINPGFENARDTLPTLPANWKANVRPGYTWQVDSSIKHSGKASLCIYGIDKQIEKNYTPFSQVSKIENKKITKITLCVYIKTKDVSKNVGLWCQLWDSTDKQIGFHSLQSKEITIKGTTDWTKYFVEMIVNSEVKKLFLGGFLDGTGQVWFDDFSIEESTNSNTLSTSKRATKYIENAINIVKKNSIVSDSINWQTVEREVKVLALGAQDYKDCYDAIKYLLYQLAKKGDNHSGFYPPTFNKKNETENMDGREPQSNYLKDSVGYISVPGFMSVNKKISIDFATKIQNQIKALDTDHYINKWIIDLRENTGGNMYPMIAGLGPILGDEILGYFTSPKQKLEYSWEYKKGSSMAYGDKICTVAEPYILKNKIKKIIVLVSSHTGSSGEMTAISFIGNENTILVGQPTAGFSTGNAGHKLADGAVLNLCESYCMDRNKKNIIGSIKPDQILQKNQHADYDNELEIAYKIIKE